MKTILKWYLLIHGFLACGQVLESDSLLMWKSNRFLIWKDFKGVPMPIKMHNKAGTGMYIGYSYSQEEGHPPNFKIYNYFDKCRSWSLTKDERLLEHEQLHFDISELYVRKTRKYFDSLNAMNVLDPKEYLRAKEKIAKESYKLQQEYDEDVLLDFPRQDKWRKLIDKELEKLKEYEFIPEE